MTAEDITIIPANGYMTQAAFPRLRRNQYTDCRDRPRDHAHSGRSLSAMVCGQPGYDMPFAGMIASEANTYNRDSVAVSHWDTSTTLRVR